MSSPVMSLRSFPAPEREREHACHAQQRPGSHPSDTRGGTTIPTPHEGGAMALEMDRLGNRLRAACGPHGPPRSPSRSLVGSVLVRLPAGEPPDRQVWKPSGRLREGSHLRLPEGGAARGFLALSHKELRRLSYPVRRRFHRHMLSQRRACDPSPLQGSHAREMPPLREPAAVRKTEKGEAQWRTSS